LGLSCAWGAYPTRRKEYAQYSVAQGNSYWRLRDKPVRDELYVCEEIAVECVCDDEIGNGVLEPRALGALPRYGITKETLG